MTRYRNQTREQLLVVIRMLNDELTHAENLNDRYRDIIQELEEESAMRQRILQLTYAADWPHTIADLTR